MQLQRSGARRDRGQSMGGSIPCRFGQCSLNRLHAALPLGQPKTHLVQRAPQILDAVILQHHQFAQQVAIDLQGPGNRAAVDPGCLSRLGQREVAVQRPHQSVSLGRREAVVAPWSLSCRVPGQTRELR